MSRNDLVNTFASTVRGGERHQTESDYSRELANADHRAKRRSRFRAHLTMDGPDTTAVLYACGCVAGVKDTRAAAEAWVDWQDDNPYTDPAKWQDVTFVGATATFEGPKLVVRDADGQVLPTHGPDCRGDA